MIRTEVLSLDFPSLLPYVWPCSDQHFAFVLWQGLSSSERNHRLQPWLLLGRLLRRTVVAVVAMLQVVRRRLRNTIAKCFDQPILRWRWMPQPFRIALLQRAVLPSWYDRFGLPTDKSVND